MRTYRGRKLAMKGGAIVGTNPESRRIEIRRGRNDRGTRKRLERNTALVIFFIV